MSMSHAYGVPDDEESIATLHYALDLGINFWDTADFYGNGKNEELIAKVLKENRDKIFIATKFGFRATEDGKGSYFDGTPAISAELRRPLQRRLIFPVLKVQRILPFAPVRYVHDS